VYVPHKIFEKKPLLGLLLGTVSLAFATLGLIMIAREYRGFGNSPQDVDLKTVAVPPEMHGKWVRVTQTLKVRCQAVEVDNQPEHQLLFGRVESTYFLAEIEGSKRLVVLQRHKKAVCDDVRRPLLVGVLSELNPQLRRTLEGGGMLLWYGQPTLLCLSCGPEDSKKYLVFFPVLMAASLWLMNRSWRGYLRKVALREGLSLGS
jgi:hypothetical protein